MMETELTDLQPVLAKTSVEVDEMIIVITADTEAADITKAGAYTRSHFRST